MKGVIYARQSSGSDDLSESVEAQVANCRKLAQREGIEIVGIYRDLNSSGETYPLGAEEIAAVDGAYRKWLSEQSNKRRFRPGLGELLSRLREVDVILVNELTRLYRPINGSFLEGHINHLLRDCGIKVLQVQGGSIDLAKFDQQLITSIKNQILYDDLQKKRQNSINAFRNKRDSGRLCAGTRAFGLQYLGNDRVRVIPECVEIIRWIYGEILASKPYNSIVRQCNTRWRDRRFFYASSIYSIARQPLYAGYQYNSAGELIRNIQMTGQEVVTLEEWRAVQQIIDQKRRGACRRTKKNWLPLSSRLFCGECGGRLICHKDHGVLYYTCNRRNLSEAHLDCRNSRIRFSSGARGGAALYDAIYPLLAIGLVERQKVCCGRVAGVREVAILETEVNRMKALEQKLFDLFSEGLATDEQLRDMLANHKARRQELEAQAAVATEASSPSPRPQDDEFGRKLYKLHKQLKAKALSQFDYEQLLDEAEITATVFRNEVIFHTKYGDVTLPRIQVKNRLSMPEWEYQILSSTTKVDEDTKFLVTYKTGTRLTLADFGTLVVRSR